MWKPTTADTFFKISHTQSPYWWVNVFEDSISYQINILVPIYGLPLLELLINEF